MNRSTKTILVLGTIAAGAGLLWWLERDAGASPRPRFDPFDPDLPFDPEPDPSDGPGGTGPGGFFSLPQPPPGAPVPMAELRPLIDLTTSGEEYAGACIVNGGTVDRNRTGAWVADAMRKLGYLVSDSLTTTADKKEIERFQARAAALRFTGTVGPGMFPIDGRVGLCTLQALEDAALQYNAGAWGGP